MNCDKNGKDFFRCKLVPELTVIDFDDSRHFYTDVLGFQIKYQRVNPKFAYLEFEDSHLMIEEMHEDGWNTPEMAPPLGKGINLQIECENVHLIRSSILAHNHTLYMDITENWYAGNQIEYGNLELITIDPNGYMLRFAQDLGCRPITDNEQDQSA